MGIRCPGTSIMDGSTLLCGCWELNSGSQEKQQVLLATEASLQPCELLFEPVPVCAV